LYIRGEQRGEVSLELRGDLAAFLRLADDGPAGESLPPADAKTAATRGGSGGSIGMMGSLVAGAGNHRQLTPMMVTC
jgi:hypothetical protein